MGAITLAGLWEPGTVVSLHPTDGPHTLRAHGAPVEQRIADKNGTVGFIVDNGDRFFAVGFDVHGERIELRCRALAEGEASFLAQPPIQGTPQKRGTSETTAPVIQPAPPAAELATGIPVLPIGTEEPPSSELLETLVPPEAPVVPDEASASADTPEETPEPSAAAPLAEPAAVASTEAAGPQPEE